MVWTTYTQPFLFSDLQAKRQKYRICQDKKESFVVTAPYFGKLLPNFFSPVAKRPFFDGNYKILVFSQSQKQKNFLNDQKITFELQITTLEHYCSRVTGMYDTASSLRSQFVIPQQNEKTNIYLLLSFFSVINKETSG